MCACWQQCFWHPSDPVTKAEEELTSVVKIYGRRWNNEITCQMLVQLPEIT